MAHKANWSDTYLEGERSRGERPYLLVFLAAVCLIAAAAAISSTRSDRARMEGTTVAVSSSKYEGADPELRPVRQTTRVIPSTTAPLLRTGSADQRSAAPQARLERRANPEGYGCSYALAWLASHAAPGFRFVCPGYALGHQAMTCDNVNGVCPGEKIIVISVPCAAAYMNEAHNSWIVAGLAKGSYDPYGYCH